MNLCLQFLIMLVIIMYVIYLSRANQSLRENFIPYPQPNAPIPIDPDGMETRPAVQSGHSLRHPERDIMNLPENVGPTYLDPETIAKLKKTILVPGASFEDQAKVAYNDVA